MGNLTFRKFAEAAEIDVKAIDRCPRCEEKFKPTKHLQIVVAPAFSMHEPTTIVVGIVFKKTEVECSCGEKYATYMGDQLELIANSP
jgi:hypothetical protein